MTAIVFAQAGEKVLLAEKILAVIGGAVMGGLVVGVLAQLLARAFTTQKLPRWPLLTVRLLGAVIGGWLVALWVLGGGGAGLGGAGGWGLGSGPGKGEGEKAVEVSKQEGEGKKNGETRTPADETMRIEVLGDATLSESDITSKHWYRIDTDEGSRLLTFDEVKKAIKNRQQQQQPPLRRIEMVLYKDSPDERVPRASQLRMWASELNGGKMKVDILQPDADAPRK